jgi:hypothetical protein
MFSCLFITLRAGLKGSMIIKGRMDMVYFIVRVLPYKTVEGLRKSIIAERQQQISERTDNHDESAPAIHNEICTIINKLKTNKAAGTDNITGELKNMAEEP